MPQQLLVCAVGAAHAAANCSRWRVGGGQWRQAGPAPQARVGGVWRGGQAPRGREWVACGGGGMARRWRQVRGCRWAACGGCGRGPAARCGSGGKRRGGMGRQRVGSGGRCPASAVVAAWRGGGAAVAAGRRQAPHGRGRAVWAVRRRAGDVGGASCGGGMAAAAATTAAAAAARWWQAPRGWRAQADGVLRRHDGVAALAPFAGVRAVQSRSAQTGGGRRELNLVLFLVCDRRTDREFGHTVISSF